MNNQELIAEMRRFEKQLTPGDWTVDPCGSPDCWCSCIGTTDPKEHERGVIPSGCVDAHDAEALVFIRNNLLRLLELAEGKDVS